MKAASEKCVRRLSKIYGENFYILKGDSFLQISVPYENRPENSDMRMAVEHWAGEVGWRMNEEGFNMDQIDLNDLTDNRKVQSILVQLRGVVSEMMGEK